MTHKIFAGPADQANQKPLLGEAKASAAISPGAIVAVDKVSGEAAPSADTTFAQLAFVAKEIGSHFGATIETPYEIGENVQYIKVRSGEFVYVKADAGTSIAPDTALVVSDTNAGNVKAAALLDGTENVLFYATGKPGETVATDGDLILVYKA